ncbi:MAG: YsnF/AvaK domain-containing protein [Candidatus Eremiobacteraeota bacterium]|nr:YsnF/AvaK domain-containing protein [Candidatus Eremiobacteraeota bacterium]
MYDQKTQTHGSTLVATFATRDEAHRAVENLHDEGFHQTWIGIMRAPASDAYAGESDTSGAVVESDNAIARFFGAGDESLHAALVKHGVAEADAARVAGTLPIDSAVLTVDGANHPELAAQIVAQCGGQMIASSGASTLYDQYAGDGDTKTLSTDRLASIGDYQGGAKIEEPRRMQLREERITIDKNREKTGEATIAKKVVSADTAVDVPVYHEELFVERRPATGSYGDVGTIGDGETIRVPLEKETVSTSKQTVVTGEVAVGQRRVEGVEHVTETLKKEELEVTETPRV